MESMNTITLNNGVEMPQLGYGVFQVAPNECKRCVLEAIAAGYRMIDTAQAYFNEEGVGAAVQESGVPREQIFLTTKVWISNAGEEKAMASIDESLRKLRTDYIDLLLIHQAYGDYYGTYRAMEKALSAGKVRAIGVSNFQVGRFVDLALHVEVPPAVNQLEAHVFSQQRGIESVLSNFGTKLMAWSPLGQGRNGLFTHPTLAAIGARHGKSPAQVALRFLLQHGFIIIPKTTHPQRMRENADIFNFALSEQEMKELAQLNEKDTGNVNFDDPAFIRYLIETYG